MENAAKELEDATVSIAHALNSLKQATREAGWQGLSGKKSILLFTSLTESL